MPPLYAFDRRGFLRLGGAGTIGCMNFSSRAAAEVSADKSPGFSQAKSVLHVHLSGGPSQLDVWDPKPDAPSKVRGEFKPIATAVPGIQVCEHLPKLAEQIKRWAIVRTLAHREHNHLLATRCPHRPADTDCSRWQRHGSPGITQRFSELRCLAGFHPTASRRHSQRHLTAKLLYRRRWS